MFLLKARGLLPHSVMMERKMKINTLNPYITCNLCKGYLIEATAITECLHTFCKSCIIKYLEDNTTCPTCKIVIHHSYPRQYINLDRTLQDIVFKLIPGLQQNEVEREKLFYKQKGLPYPKDDEGAVESAPAEERRSISISPPQNELITIRLVCCTTDTNHYNKALFIRVPTKTTVFYLKKFAARRFYDGLFHDKVDVYCDCELLDSSDTLKFVYLTKWRSFEDVPLELKCRLRAT